MSPGQASTSLPACFRPLRQSRQPELWGHGLFAGWRLVIHLIAASNCGNEAARRFSGRLTGEYSPCNRVHQEHQRYRSQWMWVQPPPAGPPLGFPRPFRWIMQAAASVCSFRAPSDQMKLCRLARKR